MIERGIDSGIIQQCMDNGSFYESLPHHNCVFAGRDKNGKAKSAALRGTHGGFKRDVKGSDKRWGFCLPASAAESKMVAVFESAVDALSGATIRKQLGQGWKDSHYLALGGTSPVAPVQFIRDREEIRGVAVCLDNDIKEKLLTKNVFVYKRHDILAG